MEVILLTKIEGLGGLGEIVRVKPGYARNYLIPQKKAQFATPQNIEDFKHLQAELEAKEQAQYTQAVNLREQLEGKRVQVKVNVHDDGAIYGSVGSAEIIQSIEEACGQKISKQQVRLPHGAFRQLGIFPVEIFLYTGVLVQLELEIIAQE